VLGILDNKGLRILCISPFSASYAPKKRQDKNPARFNIQYPMKTETMIPEIWP
jgi:hypothetical protein